MRELLRINIRDFYKISEECFQLVQDNKSTYIHIHTILEILSAGGDEYCRDGHTFELTPYSASGIKILASIVAALMLKSHLKLLDSPKITGITPEPDSKIRSLCKIPLEEKDIWKNNQNPTIKKWCQLFKIPIDNDIDLNTIFYD